MFDVQHEDDAWDVGVLWGAGLIDGSASELGIPQELEEFFEYGQHDGANVPESRVLVLAARWQVDA